MDEYSIHTYASKIGTKIAMVHMQYGIKGTAPSERPVCPYKIPNNLIVFGTKYIPYFSEIFSIVCP